MEKKIVKRLIYSGLLSDLDGRTIDEAIVILKKFLNHKEYSDVRLYKDTEYDYGGGEYIVLNVIGERLETDSELAILIKKDSEQREYQERKDKELFKQLKKKFEG